jgi:hypothetical protein
MVEALSEACVSVALCVLADTLEGQKYVRFRVVCIVTPFGLVLTCLPLI